MRRILLRRFAESDDGTFGRLYIPFDAAKQFCYTLEEEDADNRPGESLIPAGTYTCRRTIYHRHGIPTFEVTNVLDRTRILFHSGNTEEDTAGCILLGESMGPLEVEDEESGVLRPKLAVLSSRAAFDRFMERLESVAEFRLEITDPRWRI